MEMELLKSGELGKAGKKLSGPSAWRLAFPLKGCIAKAADDEARAAILADIETVKGSTRERLIVQMNAAGTMPEEPQPPTVEPFAVVIETAEGVEVQTTKRGRGKKQTEPTDEELEAMTAPSIEADK